jgi:hypothetical protein
VIDQPTDARPNARRHDLIQRLDRGDFDAAFEVTMRPDALRAGFELAAYTARADHDPATDFDAFTASLWRQVANMFDLSTP